MSRIYKLVHNEGLTISWYVERYFKMSTQLTLVQPIRINHLNISFALEYLSICIVSDVVLDYRDENRMQKFSMSEIARFGT